MMRKASALIIALWACALPGLVHGAALAQDDRAAAERAIRKTLYELEYAYATGDVETVRRLTAKRTRDLYRLYFTALASGMQVPSGTPDDAQGATAAGGDDLFALMLQAVGAGVGESKTPEEIREQARKNAARPITLIDGRSARVAGGAGDPPSLAVLEDGLWKIDDAETLKAEFLKSAELSPEVKKRIKEF